MKNAFKFTSFFLILFFVWGTLMYAIPDPYGKAYQRALGVQYDYYQSIDENKVVAIGGSSLSFGLNLDQMEEILGKPCVILGNYYEYGLTYVMEMSKSNLKPGDIVVVEYSSQSANMCDAQLILSGIGKRYEMYQYFFPRLIGALIKELPAFSQKTVKYWSEGGFQTYDVAYSLEAYDGRGNMVLAREECSVPNPYPFNESFPEIDLIDGEFILSLKNDGFIKYLNEYTQWCKERGIQVLVTVPCFLDEAVTSTAEDMEYFDSALSSQFDAPYISSIQDYIFEREYMYNTVAHCNTAGAERRTQQLCNDILPYISVSK